MVLERATLLDPNQIRITSEFSDQTIKFKDVNKRLHGYGRGELIRIRESAIRAVDQSLEVLTDRAESQSTFNLTAERIALFRDGATLGFEAAYHVSRRNFPDWQHELYLKGVGFMKRFLECNDLNTDVTAAALELQDAVLFDPALPKALGRKFPRPFLALGEYFLQIGQEHEALLCLNTGKILADDPGITKHVEKLLDNYLKD